MEGADAAHHLVFIPYMAQGHLIPMIDIARLFARRGATATIVTTPTNAARFTATTDREIAAGLPIQIHTVPFPAVEAGLPEGCESLDLLPSGNMMLNFFDALMLWRSPVELLLNQLRPRPLCIVSDVGIPWSSEVAHNLGIPRFVFHGFGCFSLICVNYLEQWREMIASGREPFSIPGLPEKIMFTKAQAQFVLATPPEFFAMRDTFLAGEETADGIVINTFDAMEEEFLVNYKTARGKEVWALGPFSLCNSTTDDKADRGSKCLNSNGEDCIKWLDMKDPESVIYVCFGSLSHLKFSDLKEVGLRLEASHHNFIWVVRLDRNSQEMVKWLEEERFEERVKGRGLIIKGWAPQVLILSHPSVGAFFTHCGWNSILEGISAGVPLVTWPMFAEQFFNEKLVVDVLQVGVSLGVEEGTKWGFEEEGKDLVDRENVKKALDKVMYDGEEGMERRKKAKELARMAKEAMDIGGSSYKNLDLLLDFAINYSELQP